MRTLGIMPELCFPSLSVHQFPYRRTRSLRDLCLRCIGDHLDTIPNVSRYLAPTHKEAVLELVANHDKLTKPYLPYITYNLFSSALKQINFYNCNQITDAVLTTLGKTGCQLETLIVHGCTNVADAGIKSFMATQHEITNLALRKLPHLTDQGLVNINLPLIHNLDLRQCTSLTSAGIRDLLKRNACIKELDLSFCSGLDEKVFLYIASILGVQLQCLDITSLHFMTDDNLIQLSKGCANLNFLSIHGCNRLTAVGAASLFQHCNKLQYLDFSYCSLAQNALSLMQDSIQELSLCGVLINDEELFVSCVSRLKHLRLVRLCGVSSLNDNTLEQILSSVGHDLISLDLSGSVLRMLTDECIKSIVTYCLSLQKLALSLLQVSAIHLIPLLKDKNRASLLTCLLLSCKPLSPEVADVLPNTCFNLTNLDFAGVTFVDDLLLTRIAENCTRLNHINLKGCRNVTDAGLIALTRHCPLRVCVLSGCPQLTDQTLFALANNCPYLEQLFLNGCNMMSSTALTYLKDQCIPRLWYTHKTPNVMGDRVLARNLNTGDYGPVPPTQE